MLHVLLILLKTTMRYLANPVCSLLLPFTQQGVIPFCPFSRQQSPSEKYKLSIDDISLKSYFHPYLFLFAWRSVHPLYDSYSFLIFHLQTSSVFILHSLCHHSLPPSPSMAHISMQNETKEAVCTFFSDLKNISNTDLTISGLFQQINGT